MTPSCLVEVCCLLAGYLLGLVFDPKDGGSGFLRNAGDLASHSSHVLFVVSDEMPQTQDELNCLKLERNCWLLRTHCDEVWEDPNRNDLLDCVGHFQFRKQEMGWTTGPVLPFLPKLVRACAAASSASSCRTSVRSSRGQRTGAVERAYPLIDLVAIAVCNYSARKYCGVLNSVRTDYQS